jgi:hypothetical protein
MKRREERKKGRTQNMMKKEVWTVVRSELGKENQ